MQNHRYTVRNLNPDLILEAKIFALQTDQRLGDVFNQALELLLLEGDPDDEEVEYDIAA